ncbi:hypothetical protein ADUPG1_008856 [Aduncisulcus paluster]|uniref:Uncharacterized protein n=2 Tax=Aduncisulcus paluster TaxID=2918883 RepID=A0ABQ5KTI0_9EUKA|nr:hypothetical protein ADUPG1_008856 [Aduncisulcus paluster]
MSVMDRDIMDCFIEIKNLQDRLKDTELALEKSKIARTSENQHAEMLKKELASWRTSDGNKTELLGEYQKKFKILSDRVREREKEFQDYISRLKKYAQDCKIRAVEFEAKFHSEKDRCLHYVDEIERTKVELIAKEQHLLASRSDQLESGGKISHLKDQITDLERQIIDLKRDNRRDTSDKDSEIDRLKRSVVAHEEEIKSLSSENAKNLGRANEYERAVYEQKRKISELTDDLEKKKAYIDQVKQVFTKEVEKRVKIAVTTIENRSEKDSHKKDIVIKDLESQLEIIRGQIDDTFTQHLEDPSSERHPKIAFDGSITMSEKLGRVLANTITKDSHRKILESKLQTLETQCYAEAQKDMKRAVEAAIASATEREDELRSGYDEQIRQLNMTNTELKETLARLDERIEQQKAQSAEYETSIAQLRADKGSLSSRLSVISELQQSVAEAAFQNERLENDLKREKERYEDLSAKNGSLSAQLDQYKRDHAAGMKVLETERGKVHEFELKCQELEQSLETERKMRENESESSIFEIKSMKDRHVREKTKLENLIETIKEQLSHERESHSTVKTNLLRSEDQLDEVRRELTLKMDSVSQKAAKKERTLQEEHSKHVEESNSAILTLRTQLTERDSQISELETKIGELEAHLAQLETLISRKDAEIEERKLKITELDGIKGDLMTHRSELVELKEQLVTISNEKDQLSSDLRDKEDQIDSYKRSISSLEDNITSDRQEIGSLQKEIAIIQKDVASKKQSLSKTVASLQKETNLRRASEDEVRRLKSISVKVEKEASDLKFTSSETQRKMEENFSLELEEQTGLLRKQIAELELEKTELQQRHEEEMESEIEEMKRNVSVVIKRMLMTQRRRYEAELKELSTSVTSMNEQFRVVLKSTDDNGKKRMREELSEVDESEILESEH